MDTVVDSKKKQLSFQEVMMYRVKDEDEKKQLPHSAEVVLLTLIEELKMPSCEAILFGNTFFIYHVNKGRTGAVVRMLNVDTATNLIDNSVKFARHMQKEGIEHFMSTYEYKGYTKLFDMMQKKKLGTAVTKRIGDKGYVTCVTVAKGLGKKQ